MPNATLVNFAAGETSPRSRGRFDRDWFKSACEKCLNFIPEVPGPARFRSGFRFVRKTRAGAVARLIPFQVNDTASYMLEFTDSKMRVYKNGDLLTVARTTVTAITQASTAVITVASTSGLANGDEIIITDIVGMVELNNRQVKLSGASGSTFQLVDPVTGAGIDSTGFGAYSSGGTLVEVYEIASPYLESDLDNIQFAQSKNQMYFANSRFAPYKLTVDAADVFTLGTYSRTNDPFVSSIPIVTITAISLGNGTGFGVVLTLTAGNTVSASTLYTLSTIVGTTQLNGNAYYLNALYGFGGAPRYYLTTGAPASQGGTIVDGSAYTAYSSAGIGTAEAEHPIGVAFYEARLFFIGTDQRPNSIFGSRAPNDEDPRYDDYTGGTNADHAVFFALAPVNGQVDVAAWGQGSEDYFFVGTFGGPFRVSGGGLDEPITPSSINVRQFDAFGCESVMPAGGKRPFYIQRGGVALRTIRYDANDRLEAYDMLLNADHIAHSPLRRVALQTGRPDILWVVRDDGILAGMTVQGSENVAGWHRQKIGGVDAKVLDAQPLPRTDKNDQLWIVTERTIGNTTQRFVEVMADDVIFPDKEDFYTDVDSEATDEAHWKNAVYRRQEEYIYLDGAGTYDGSDRGTAASATVTPAATTGDGVIFTASVAVFAAADVGKEIWKKPDRDTGIGAGRGTIVGFTDSTHVTVDVLVDFDSGNAIPAGDWYFATDTIHGLSYLDGATVKVVTDGAIADDELVTRGTIVLEQPAAVVHAGLGYEGFIKTHNLELAIGGGPAQAKPRNISAAFIRFLYTLGVDFGTDIYDLETVEWRDTGLDAMDRPAPVFSGIRKIQNKDGWQAEEGKHLIVSQRLALPCIVQFIDIHFETSEPD